MAEFIAAVGVASSFVALIDCGSKIVARLIEYQSMCGSVPEVFRGIHTQLPLLLACVKETELAADEK